MQVDVSIIIPAYNRLWSLPEAVESCRNTTCKTEIIVIDDGSTDGSWEWIQQQKDIIAIKQDNWGKCWAANAGYAKARGKYIKFLDSDDILLASSIDEQFNLAEQTDTEIVVSGYILMSNEGTYLRKQKWIYCEDFIAQQLGECDSSHYSAYLFKKEILADIPHRPDFAFRDDRLLVLEVALKNPKIAFHNGYGLLHRKHEKNRLQFNNGMQQITQNYQHFNIYKKVFNLLQLKGELTERRKNAAIPVLWNLCHWIAKHNINDALKVYEFIKELNPEFTIKNKGAVGFLYKKIGFKTTEEILFIRRFFKYGFQ